MGVGIGRFIYEQMLEPGLLAKLSGKPISTKEEQDSTSRERTLLIRSFLFEALLVVAYLVSCQAFGRPSRRLCNLPYVLYQCASIHSIVCYLHVLDRLLAVRHENMLESAINYNQLQFFVWANLLTGYFNLSMKTYYESRWAGYITIFLYILANVLYANSMKKRGILKNVL
jgi:hypothetical protein